MLIASLIFTLGVVAVMSMIVFALTAHFSSRIESTALRLSQQKIEELKAHGWDGPLLSVPGNALNSAGEIDFNASADPQATSTTAVLLNQSRSTVLAFETRWNVTNAGSKKIITVATRKTEGSPIQLKPVNLKVVLAP
jgi:Tfp pilus assembly protein PilV